MLQGARSRGDLSRALVRASGWQNLGLGVPVSLSGGANTSEHSAQARVAAVFGFCELSEGHFYAYKLITRGVDKIRPDNC
jgi:hypothetical protein